MSSGEQLAQANQAAQEAGRFVSTFNEVILFPTIALLSAVALFVFLWGLAEYLFNANNEEARRKGVRHITFGIIGLVIMLSAFSILSIFAGTFGLNDELNCYDDPTVSGCESQFTIPSQSGGPTGGNPGGPTGGNPGGPSGSNP
jgi:hypothetical protein